MNGTETGLYTLTPPTNYDDKNGTNPHHISCILPALTSAIGTPVTTPLHHHPQTLARTLGLPETRSAILVLIDGVGYHNMRLRRGHAPYLRALMDAAPDTQPLHTCYPATTVAAMGTLGTGTCPGMTGMTGYTQLNPTNGKISQMIAFRDAIPPEQLQTQPPIFTTLTTRGTRVTSIGLPRFANSALTRAAFQGADYQASKNADERVELAAQAAKTPGLTYVYTNICDKAGHTYGWESPQWTAAFEELDARLTTLHKTCPKNTLIVITADHGMIQSDPEKRIDIATNPILNRDIHLIGGEPRAPMLYLLPDTNPHDVAQRWQEQLGDRAEVTTRDEAVKNGLYGPIRPDILPMIGDIIITTRGHTTIVDSRTQDDKATRMPGVHGSRTYMETQIPLLIDLT